LDRRRAAALRGTTRRKETTSSPLGNLRASGAADTRPERWTAFMVVLMSVVMS
jgi:hypothetical protein